MNHNKYISARFQTFRKRCVAKTQLEAGKKLGVSQSKISDLESSNIHPDINMLIIMYKDYGLNINWLATGDGDMMVNTQEKFNSPTISELLVEIEVLKRTPELLQSVISELRNDIVYLNEKVSRIEVRKAKRTII
jgi:transcriptional regulator with XRE-family HTH domain